MAYKRKDKKFAGGIAKLADEQKKLATKSVQQCYDEIASIHRKASNFPWCETCKSWHHSENPTCRRLADKAIDEIMAPKVTAATSYAPVPFSSQFNDICSSQFNIMWQRTVPPKKRSLWWRFKMRIWLRRNDYCVKHVEGKVWVSATEKHCKSCEKETIVRLEEYKKLRGVK